MNMVFVVDKAVLVSPAPGVATQGTNFDLDATIDEQRLTFRFSWNGHFQFYTIDILRSNGDRVKTWRPAYTDDAIIIRNWNPNNAEYPDAKLAFIDTEGQGRAITPSRLGVSHHIAVMMGVVME